MPKELLKIPKNALLFNEHNEGFAESDGKKFLMVAYSGKVIKNHFWWGDLMINLSGMKFQKAKYPILEDHMGSKKIGFVPRPKDIGNSLRFEDITFVDTKESTEFQDLSKQGFPFEASIRAQPTKITRLAEGESAEVNGMKFKGPGTIWEESIFKEASVTVFGYDSQTKSQAFQEEGEVELEVEQFGEVVTEEPETHDGGTSIMNKEQLKAEHPELYAEIFGEGEKAGQDAAELKFTSEKSTLEQANTELKGTVTELSETVRTQGESLESLKKQEEKREALQLEAGLKSQANKIWTDSLTDSEVPEYMFDKCRKMVSHHKFVKEGKLDVEAFTEAVKNEIGDWEGKFSQEVDDDGFGTQVKGDKEHELSADDAKWEKEMSGFAGVELTQ